MSVNEKPGTSRHAVGSKIGEIVTGSLFHANARIVETDGYMGRS